MNNSKTIVDLLAVLLDNHISVFLENGELKVKVLKGQTISQDLIHRLTKNKEEIKRFLINESNAIAPSDQIGLSNFCLNRKILDNPPLSFSQQGLWIVDTIQGNSVQFNMPTVLTYNGPLEKDKLQNAFRQIINRHEVLRTVFKTQNGIPYQVILQPDKWELSYSENPQLKNKYVLDELARTYGNSPFDLSADHMLRAQLIKVDSEKYIILLVFHHIAIDGWSMSLFVGELIASYQAQLKSRVLNLPPLPLQYKDFAIWQRTYFTDQLLNKELTYWEEKLRNLTPLNLPTDFSRPARMSTKGATEGIKLSQDFTMKLKGFSAKNKVSMFMLLLAAFKVLLYRYSGQDDICVGTPVANREHKELENLIGFFPNSLPLRSDMKGNPAFIDFLKQVSETCLEAFANQNAPFEKIVDRIEKSRDMSRSPLFQVMFIFMNDAEPEIQLESGKFSIDHFQYEPARFDLTIYLNESANGLSLDVIYCTALFSAERIKRLLIHFNALLKSVIKTPACRIGNLSILEEAEKKQILFEFNNTARPFPKEKTFIDIFNQQADGNPRKIAAVYKGIALTYDQLNCQANQLANMLLQKGAHTGCCFGVCMERSHNLLVVMLAVMKVGGTYIPIDPDYPQKRLEYILGDCKAGYIILEKDNGRFDFCDGCELIILDRDKEMIDEQCSLNLNLKPSPDTLAYTIYTSGSTGNPKGAMIEHKGMLNHLFAKAEELDINAGSRVLQNASQCFDISIWQFLVALMKGGTTFIYDHELILNSTRFLAQIASDRLTHVEVVPSYLRALFEDVNHKQLSLPDLKYMLVTGEPLPRSLASQWFERYPEIPLVNAYGPTEASDDITHFIMRGHPIQDQVPIGHVLPNMQIYVFNQHFELCPIGIPGEIGVAGICVGRGYINNSELTNSKFVENPFDKKSEYKMYLTGDIGYWMSDGNLAFTGRKDEQVKIRGHRIELGEIEAKLNASALVSQSCVVVKHELSGAKSLVAYFIPDHDEIKSREDELCRKRIENWRTLYNIEFPDTGLENEEFDIAGWNDSFTSQPIAASHMQEWLDDIVSVIMEDKPKRVFEIGCGTGLLFYRLADRVEHYAGTDFCSASINKILQKIARNDRSYCGTQFSVCAAHEIVIRPTEKFDTVILNSVAQYFSGQKYLLDVLEKSIGLIDGNGRIIIGDVRDNRLLKLFKTKLLLSKLRESASISDFEWTRDLEMANEEELCISPEFFYNLKTHYPSISHIDISWKKGALINELSSYRYTVIIYIGSDKELLTYDWHDWGKAGCRQTLIDLFNRQTNTIAVRNAPNPRLVYEKCLAECLGPNRIARTVGELKMLVHERINEDSEIDSMLSYAHSKGYQYRLLVNESPLKTNILFERFPSSGFVEQMPVLEENASAAIVINKPISRDIYALVQQQLSADLKKQLPDYLVPSGFVAIENLPLTGNGKIDRKFLAGKEEQYSRSIANFQPPRNTVEEKLARIWAELLGIKQVGIHDNFFESGGDSILIIQFVSRAEKEGLHLRPKDIFEYQTIAALSDSIDMQTAVKLAEQGILTGESILLPGQQRLLENSFQVMLPQNQGTLFLIDKSVDPLKLNLAVQSLISQHDALRFTYSKTAGGWKQSYGYYTGKLDTEQCDTAGGYAFEKAIQNICLHYRNSLNIETGELIKIVLIKTPANEEYDRLFIVMHKLITDRASREIILNDLETYLTTVEKGEVLTLPLKTASFRNFANLFNSQTFIAKSSSPPSYWETILNQYKPLSSDIQALNNPATNEWRERTIRINREDTRSILVDVCNVYGTQTDDIILFVLAKVIGDWSGDTKILIGIENDGRNVLTEQIDITNTVGYFGYCYPVVLEISPRLNLSDQIKEVKEQLRMVPANGVGFGMPGYSGMEKESNTACNINNWDISFRYNSPINETRSRLTIAPEDTGSGIFNNAALGVKWHFECEVFNGELFIKWSYAKEKPFGKTIEALVNKIYASLELIINHCRNKTGREFTPSDYGLQGIVDKKEFEEFSNATLVDGIDILKF